jgi:hypothetical protein
VDQRTASRDRARGGRRAGGTGAGRLLARKSPGMPEMKGSAEALAQNIIRVGHPRGTNLIGRPILLPVPRGSGAGVVGARIGEEDDTTAGPDLVRRGSRVDEERLDALKEPRGCDVIGVGRHRLDRHRDQEDANPDRPVLSPLAHAISVIPDEPSGGYSCHPRGHHYYRELSVAGEATLIGIQSRISFTVVILGTFLEVNFLGNNEDIHPGCGVVDIQLLIESSISTRMTNSLDRCYFPRPCTVSMIGRS